jgi:hypothetical protein
MILDFVEDIYAPIVIWRRVFAGVSVILFFGVLFFSVLWIFTPSPKNTEDYLYDYVRMRYNYEPSTVESALSNHLQYTPLAYKQMIAPEINEVVKNSIYSYFRPNSIRQVTPGTYEVIGHKFVIAIKNNTPEVIVNDSAKLLIKVTGRKFYETTQ